MEDGKRPGTDTHRPFVSQYGNPGVGYLELEMEEVEGLHAYVGATDVEMYEYINNFRESILTFCRWRAFYLHSDGPRRHWMAENRNHWWGNWIWPHFDVETYPAWSTYQEGCLSMDLHDANELAEGRDVRLLWDRIYMKKWARRQALDNSETVR